MSRAETLHAACVILCNLDGKVRFTHELKPKQFNAVIYMDWIRVCMVVRCTAYIAVRESVVLSFLMLVIQHPPLMPYAFLFQFSMAVESFAKETDQAMQLMEYRYDGLFGCQRGMDEKASCGREDTLPSILFIWSRSTNETFVGREDL